MAKIKRDYFVAMMAALGVFGGVLANADTINLAEKGAKGDAVSFSATTASNSNLIFSEAASFSQGDQGKVIELFGAGEPTSGTNHQDLVASIADVVDEHSVRIRPSPGATLTNVTGIYGTDNAPVFQTAVDHASGTNTIIRIPEGNYLLIPPKHRSHEFSVTDGAVIIRKGGIRFLGEGIGKTILTDAGAWELGNEKKAYRGFLFVCKGPVTNDYPLIFENLTMDGGVTQGNTGNHGFPASPVDGSGWDLIHSAVVDMEPVPLHSMKKFLNCEFVHWRGEILKSTSSWRNGFIEVANCDFHDGDASAFNFSFSHRISDCTFSNLDMAMEFYEGRAATPSTFENSRVSDVRADLVIVGALTNHPAPPYTIRNNMLQSYGFGIFLNPAENVTITGNHFDTQGFGIGSGAGYQGTAPNRNILIEGNSFDRVSCAFHVGAGGMDRFEHVVVRSNTVTKGALAGGYGECREVTLSRNRCLDQGMAIDGGRLTGQWFLDDLSNQYQPHQVSSGRNATNILSYAFGARQTTKAGMTNSVFLIDDSRPEMIPVEAKMVITHQGDQSAALYLSTTRSNEPAATILKPGSVVTCTWTNGIWKLEKEKVKSEK